MRLNSHIHIATVDTFTLPPHHTTNCYIIGGDGEALLIDPIFESGGTLEACLQENGIRAIRYAAVTHPHPDHYGGIDALLGTYGGKLLCHRDNGKEMTFGASSGHAIERFEGDEVIRTAAGAIRVLHTPGHSPAHLCFYIEEEGILFSGDTILGYGTSIISPPEGDMADYLETLHRLAAMEIRTICPSHGPVIDRGAKERIHWYIDHRLMREERVLAALKSGLTTIAEIARAIYNEEDFQMHGRDLQPRAERTVQAHLEKLEKDGVVASAGNAPSHFHLVSPHRGTDDDGDKRGFA
jgi:glyoxylase-like metal-dependent hydrolase (beta-lactamase superfamily II)